MVKIRLAFILILLFLSGCTIDISKKNAASGGVSSKAETSCVIPEWPANVLRAEDPDGGFTQNELAVGDVRLIILYDNPSTGFAWYYEFSGDDILEIISDKYQPDPNPNNWPGVGGTRYIQIKAVGSGEAAIDMTIKRGEDEVLGTQTYKIVVSGGNDEPSETEPEEPRAILGAEDPDELIVGEIRLIVLDENRTTGYIWYWEFSGDDILEIISDEYRQDPAPPLMDGVGGTRYIGVKAVAPGEAVIEMTCKRSEDEVSQTRTYKVVVKQA